MSTINTDYVNLVINGMCYVRELKRFDEKVQYTNNIKDKNRVCGYLVVDNYNKPVKDAYRYLEHCKTIGGCNFNTLKRIAYDLCYFLDFMGFNNIDDEIIDYDYFFNFVSEYLTKIDPNFKVNDCINRSMLKSIPVLPVYKNDRVKPQHKNNVGGLNAESIRRIANNAKNYLCYLKFERGRNIELDRIFDTLDMIIKDETTTGHTSKGYKRLYTVAHIVKNAQLPVLAERIKPIEPGLVFEDYEIDKFFLELNKCSNPSYNFLFYLLKVTGMRISEALALMIFDLKYIGKDIDFKGMVSDIVLIDDTEDIWQIKIVVRKDNPDDLKIKFNKPRDILLVDREKKFRNLLTQLIIHRKVLTNKLRTKHNYLFINQWGNRLKYPVSKQKFDDISVKAGLGDRKSDRGERQIRLNIHSFRHTFASRWIRETKINKKDVELNELSEYLGHSSADITKKIYVHLFTDDYARLLERMDASSKQKEED